MDYGSNFEHILHFSSQNISLTLYNIVVGILMCNTLYNLPDTLKMVGVFTYKHVCNVINNNDNKNKNFLCLFLRTLAYVYVK